MIPLSKPTILAAFKRLGELALKESTQLELNLYGGCAMMLAFERRDITRDVDAIFQPASKARPLIRQVAAEMNLPEDWLNDDVRQFLAPSGPSRDLPLEIPGLRVMVPTASYLLAMKALAARRPLPGYEGDTPDLRFLIRKMGIDSLEEIQQHINRYYPDDVPTPAQQALLKEIIHQATAR